MTERFAGIDPGKTGAVVVVDVRGAVVEAGRTPLLKGTRSYDVRAMHRIAEAMAAAGIACCMLENVWGMRFDTPKTACAVGYGIACWDTVLELAGVRTAVVAPQRWMKGIGVPPRMERDARKKWIVDRALERWPDLPISKKADWDIADAAFIADTCRTQWRTGLIRREDRPAS